MQKYFEILLLKVIALIFFPKNLITIKNVVRFSNYIIPEIIFNNFKKKDGIAVISAGVGNDLTFDIELQKALKTNSYRLLDPTPTVKLAISFLLKGEVPQYSFKTNSVLEIQSFLESVDYLPLGLGDNDTKLPMYAKNNSVNSSFMYIHGSDLQEDNEYVQVVDVISIFREYGIPDLFKLDIEGYGARVMLRLLRCGKMPKLVLGELELFHIGKFFAQLYEILLVFKVAEDMGYEFIFYNSNKKPSIEFTMFLTDA